MKNENANLVWQKVADIDELPEGRVKTVTAGARSMVLTNIGGANAD